MNINVIVSVFGYRFAVGLGVQAAREEPDDELEEVHELHVVDVRADTERLQAGFRPNPDDGEEDE